MTPLEATRKIYTLGDIQFSVDNCSTTFAKQVDELFMPSKSSDSLIERDVFLYEGRNQNIRQLIDTVLKLHPTCLWIDAAALITPNNKKVLLTGKSGAGKSTTTLALALKYGWKMIAEDVLLIERKTNRLINFSSPSSLKGNAAELLLSTIGIEPAPLVDGEWMLMGELANQREFHAPFDIAIHFDLVHKNEPLFTERISVAEFCRTILANSNALRTEGGLSDLQETLRDTLCFRMISGSLPSRLEQIMKLVDDEEYATSFVSTKALNKILDEQPIFVRAPNFDPKLADDGSLIVTCGKTQKAYQFSQLGALVYEFCDGAHNPAQIIEEITKLFPTYEVSALREETAKLLVELEAQQVIASNSP